MSESKRLPERPSLEFERKHAKALVRLFNAGETEALTRVHAQLPAHVGPIGLRQAQFVIAREYGFDGWTALRSAFMQRAHGLERAAEQARRAIDANHVQELSRLIAREPRLLTWRDSARDGEVLLAATTSYANFPGAEHEDTWNRRECAELLLDAGATVDPRVVLRIIDTGAHGMLALFERKGVLPANLRVFAALGALDRVRASFDDAGRLRGGARPDTRLRSAYDGAAADWPDPGDDGLVLADAFLYACRLGQRQVAAFLLPRCMQLDRDLEAAIAAWEGEAAFIDFLLEQTPEGARYALSRGPRGARPGIIWQQAVELRVRAALHRNDVEAVRNLLHREAFLLRPAFVRTHARLLEVAAYSDDALPMIEAVLESGAAITSTKEPPPSRAISYALDTPITCRCSPAFGPCRTTCHTPPAAAIAPVCPSGSLTTAVPRWETSPNTTRFLNTPRS
ncbi:MAG: hypothetical protein AAF628_37135 [Planctomycetota bacterium]